MTVITTVSGRRVSLTEPQPITIYVGDIAVSLSRLCRFNGHCSLFYSVAQHSVLVARQLAAMKADPATQLLGLLHDAHEAYVGDISRPLRLLWSVDPHIAALADRLDAAIHRAFGLTRFATPLNLAQIATADEAVLAAEWRDLMPGDMPFAAAPASFAVKPVGPDKAEHDFRKCFERLGLEAGLTRNAPSGIFK